MVICELCQLPTGLLATWTVSRICLRKASSVTKPVITVPVKVQKQLEKKMKKEEEKKRLIRSRKGDVKVPIISCKRKEFNYYKGQTYGKFDNIALASKGWGHSQSKGDYFTINSFQNNPAFASHLEEETNDFISLHLREEVVQAIHELGYTEPTHIQALAIPQVLKGNNTVIAAETGSGKTIAFLAPVIQQILQQKELMREEVPYNSPLALVLTPSRELTEQIGGVCHAFSKHLPIRSKVLTGGRTMRMMRMYNVYRTDIIIASLGVIKKLFNTGIYETEMVRHIVIDEADTLLDDSFNEDLVHFLKKFQLQQNKISSSVPVFYRDVQLSLVGATLPRSMAEILQDVVEYNSLVQLTTSHLHRLMPHVPQKFLRIGKGQKPEKLLEVIKSDIKKGVPLMIFSNKSPTCDFVSLFLNENSVDCVNLNGDMPRKIRIGIFNKFQAGNVSVLSCTDIASRGLDTSRTQHVINYDFPTNMADYIHRCGRTGRVGSVVSGHVTNFISQPSEVELVMKIELATRKMDTLPNVNANIKRLIEANAMKKMQEGGSSLM